ncbi:MAG TPA: hypothetical protein VE569_02210 [Acidimicrobiia bacterium]|nr:hypothetical protein [Acidimicrobiia bacterium]
MALARVTAAASVLGAILLALLVPRAPGTVSAVLVGWVAVIVLAAGLVFGTRPALAVAAVAFILRIAMVSVAIAGVVFPIWAHTALVVVVFELAAVSIEVRTRAIPVWRSLGQVLLSTGLATLVAVVMESAVYGSAPSGLLLRVLAVAAVVILVGWIVTRWAETVES